MAQVVDILAAGDLPDHHHCINHHNVRSMFTLASLVGARPRFKMLESKHICRLHSSPVRYGPIPTTNGRRAGIDGTSSLRYVYGFFACNNSHNHHRRFANEHQAKMRSLHSSESRCPVRQSSHSRCGAKFANNESSAGIGSAIKTAQLRSFGVRRDFTCRYLPSFLDIG